MKQLTIDLPPKFASDCLLGLLYHLDPAYKITVAPDKVLISGPSPIKALKDPLYIVAQRLEKKTEIKTKKGSMPVRIPVSGNDKKVLKEMLSELGIRREVDAIEFIESVKNNLSTIFSSKTKNRLIDVLKPEFYEFNRIAGYSKYNFIKHKQFSFSTIVLSLAGYLGCSIGRVRIDDKDTINIVVTPLISSTGSGFIIDHRYQVGYNSGLKSLIDYTFKKSFWFDGLYPETALILLMAQLVGGVDVTVYGVKEPGGNNPASIYAAMQISLSETNKLLQRYGLVSDQSTIDPLTMIVQYALNLQKKNNDARNLAIRFSQILYEVIHEVKPLTELIYTANREYMHWLFKETPRKGESGYETLMVARNAVILSRKLLRYLK